MGTVLGPGVNSLATGVFAAAAVYPLNGWIAARAGTGGMVLLVPAVEEGAKTLPAVLLDCPIFLAHAAFGTVEAVYDTLVTRKTGIWAGLASFFGHLAFGLLTQRVFQITGSAALGVLGAYLVHLAWNWLVLGPLPGEKTGERIK